MPEHKMITIDGVRYRSEDAHRAPRTRKQRVPSTAPVRETAQVEVEGVAYDPGAHNVDEVLAYLESADAEETERVLAAEAEGKARKTILDTRESAASVGDGGDKEGGGDGDSSGAAG